jgi:hypothetical protein
MWTHRGISGKYELSCIGTKAGAVTVIGGARCVWDDLSRLNMRERGDIMVVNDIGMYLDWPIDHWVSLHKIDLRNWLRLRRSHSMAFGAHFEAHSQESHDGITNAWYLDNPMPYSGMFAVQVALALGYERITLCGIPQDGQANFFTPPWVEKTHDDSNEIIKQMADKNDEFKRCVRSMSGGTREWWGEP